MDNDGLEQTTEIVTSKIKPTMIYTRAHLNAMQRSPEYVRIATQNLMEAVLAGHELTLAESKFLGTIMNTMGGDNEEGIKLLRTVYSNLTDFHFWEKYLLYGHDLEGQYEKITPYGLVTFEEKRVDVIYLEQLYQLWIPIIEKENHTDALLQFLTIEIRRTIKDVLKHSKSRGDGGNHQRYIHKSLTLHSRFVYLKIKEYYQENPAREESKKICGSNIIVDINTYVHILLRHFGEAIMEGRPGKTYHHDLNIDVDHLPPQIFQILTAYEELSQFDEIRGENIFFELNDSKYAIWLQSKVRKINDQPEETFYRVATFYPAALKPDLEKIELLTLSKYNEILSFYL